MNTQLIELYWRVGRDLAARQDEDGWGSKIIARLATDLRSEVPDMTGVSPRNLQYMVTFAKHWHWHWHGVSMALQPVTQLPWGYIRMTLDKNLSAEARTWYAAAAVEYGWSRMRVHPGKEVRTNLSWTPQCDVGHNGEARHQSI